MDWTPAGKLLSEAAVRVFRANGLVLRAGDELAAPSGLTSARWQILGVVDHGPATQSEVARIMGLTRQTVRETAKALRAEGLLETMDNPHHRRVKLMAITADGRRRLRAIEARQVTWANRIASRLSRATLKALGAGLTELCEALEADVGEPPRSSQTTRSSRARVAQPRTRRPT